MGVCDPNFRTAEWALYRYDPSTAAAVIFILLFIVTTGIHTVQMIRTRTWYMAAFCIGGLSEILGYIGRAVSSNEKAGCWTVGPFVVQTVFTLIAPALMSFSVYMILPRIIHLTDGEIHAPMKPRWRIKVFIIGDVVSLALQLVGGAMMSGGDLGSSVMKTGKYLVIGSFSMQPTVIGTFFGVVSLFHRRMKRTPTEKSLEPQIRWRRYVLSLYIASGAISARCLFRSIAYYGDNDSYLMRSEWFLYIFDATIIWAVMVWMIWFHPSEIDSLLRHERPVANGLELLSFNNRFRK
ncbi:RTA1 like protein-domain-containing protein [Plectosphaerella plurivora]|uniref:RTA1 like protein-domain-containing protein n=1 Tax=Plectosphaerella plurivora TaxID=936078 RepID=A0A9P8VD57_9PEZI|nr:RTA1 like protein-domain-containing protein [Plectosphaerella plurivora]